ncbi:hypothetical protein PC118_g22514 [Phytophthora cactorum]|uniref:Uncharacterized protein n=4 Tax=Phytophthora cactorum TaxID=29920 RepID=A0A8T1ET13_9STRA|nr:hypothetical protein PC118_g22514 [Phytophthora cactorum]
MAGQMIHVKRNMLVVKNAWTGNRFSWSMDNKNTCPLCVEATRVTGCARTTERSQTSLMISNHHSGISRSRRQRCNDHRRGNRSRFRIEISCTASWSRVRIHWSSNCG